MLSARSITWLIKKGVLEWDGQLRGDGLLLTLGSPLQPMSAPVSLVVDLADQSSIDDLYGEPLGPWTTYDLVPGAMLLGPVRESLRLRAGLMGMIGGLSHLARLGLAVHVTSPFVLPGWNGHLTLELVNTSPAVLRLRYGMPLARLLVFGVDGPGPDDAEPHPFYGRETDLRSRYADEFPVGPIEG
jgi:deoxycytidine triphosphate deaminase